MTTPPFRSKLPDLVIADAAEPALSLTALRPENLALIEAWLQVPHVRRWYGISLETELAEIAAHMGPGPVSPFLMREHGHPIGYLQIYHANEDEFWNDHDLPRETFGIDLMIGKADAIGRGLGPAAIKLATRRLFQWPRVRRIHIDPDPANGSAVRAYEKAGFRPVAEITTPDGPALYMMIERP